jgi:hypothetical protein
MKISRLVPIHNFPPAIFLNCTKNTELTSRPFARTFTFALNQKLNRTQPKTFTGMRPNALRLQHSLAITIRRRDRERKRQRDLVNT